MARIAGSIGRITEAQVGFDRTIGKARFLVPTRREGRCGEPEQHQNRNCCQQAEEDGEIEASMKLAGQVERDEEESCDEHVVVEAVTARGISRKWCVLDGWVLLDCVSAC